MFSFQGACLEVKGSAPLAQLVEQLTLNQWVLGSSPRRRTKAQQMGEQMARWSSG